MSNDRKKHKILKALKSKWDEACESKGAGHFSIHDSSLYPNELSKRTKIKANTLNDICHILYAEGFIKRVNSGNVNLPDKYHISTRGRIYVTDKKFLNQLFWRKFDFWKFLLPLLLAVIALLNSIFHWWET